VKKEMHAMTEPVTKTKAAELSKPEPARGSGTYFTPRVDVWETDQELLFQADMPGVKPDDISLHYEQGVLSLHGRVHPGEPRGREISREFDVGDYYRTFAVHDEVDASKISADFKQGVLTVRLPKREEVKPRRIAISAA
jgi:HSP20 family molecular chaperone IbpA